MKRGVGFVQPTRVAKAVRARESWYCSPMRAALALSVALTLAPIAAQADPVDPRVALLDRDARHARIWFWSFTAAYSLSAAAQTTLALGTSSPNPVLTACS